MIGLGVAELELGERNYNIVFKDPENIKYVQGLTNLADVVIFNVLSSYDPVTGRGSKIPTLIGNMLLDTSGNTSIAKLQLTEEVIALELRIKAFQDLESGLSTDERLGQLDILQVTVDSSASRGIISIRIVAMSGNVAYVEGNING